MKRNLLLTVLLIAVFPLMQAQLKLPSFFGNHMVLQQDMLAPVWGTASPGSVIRVKASWSKSIQSATADAQGRWKVSLKTPLAGGPYKLEITDGKDKKVLEDVLTGEVWILGGQSNMEMPMKGMRDQPVDGSTEEILHSAGTRIRWFKVPRSSVTTCLDTIKPFDWKLAGPDNLAELSATGWFFAKALASQVHVPIGLISCNYGGSTAEAWMRPEALAGYGDYFIPKPGEKIPHPSKTATVLYNGMLHPLIGYSIRGVVWYQGESNYPKPERYETLFPHLVKEWRQLWGQGEFPFYYVQIAPYHYPTLKDTDCLNSAYLRDAQRKVEPLIPNSGMAVLTDGGDSLYIHPRTKQLPGLRLALLALAKTYGFTGIPCASPKYQSMEVKDAEVTLTFSDAPDGLSTYGKPLDGFEVAGEDRIFHPASARISAGKVVVSCAAVNKPVAVRYDFRDFVRGSLFGCNGLPVSSFRTDDWPVERNPRQP